MNFPFKNYHQFIEFESLLDRVQFKIVDKDSISYLQNKSVLITGAGGSIGKELSLQITNFKPSYINLLDISETPLFEVCNELKQLRLDFPVNSFIGDIKNLSRIDYIFKKVKPKVIFHTAAYKHVPIMEKNPCEAILNNVNGTINLINLSIKHNVERFIFISTDKAVNPKNIMGASKRICELYIKNLEIKNDIKFTTVRFGNVLGSNGSVLPVFLEQIRKGGPITITHPEVSRFFMTIPEAIQLILQAGSLGIKKDIFVLDMGKAIKIKDLAEKMIKLLGFKPYEDIKINFIGMRPGEKLFEELSYKTETLKKTKYSKILTNISLEDTSKNFFEDVEDLIKFAEKNKVLNVIEKIQKIIPQYQIIN